MLTWHSVHVIKLLAIDANPVIFLGLAPSDEQLPGAASVTNAALHASAEHVLAVLDAIENDMVPTVNLNGHHLNLRIDGGTGRTALNVSRARESATGAFWTRHLCLDDKPGMLSRVFCHKSENSLPKNEKTVKKRGSGRMNNVHFISYLEVFVIRVISGKRSFLISWRWRLLCLLALRTFR